jgi:hypothetical protein
LLETNFVNIWLDWGLGDAHIKVRNNAGQFFSILLLYFFRRKRQEKKEQRTTTPALASVMSPALTNNNQSRDIQLVSSGSNSLLPEQDFILDINLTLCHRRLKPEQEELINRLVSFLKATEFSNNFEEIIFDLEPRLLFL